VKDDYYGVLGVNPSASPQSIQAAYRKLAKACHPDYAGVEGTEKFQIVQEAYEVLSDPDKREAYDSQSQQNAYRPVRYDIAPEPLVPVRVRRSFDPEPLVQQHCIPEQFSNTDRAHCPFGHRLGHERGMPCPFCMPDGILSELQEFIRHWRTPFRY
jgi:curved DNA-binding protein CbpA